MILDGLLRFCAAQAVTATANSTNIIDLVNAADWGAGKGESLMVRIFVNTTCTASGAATVDFQIIGAPQGDSGFASPYILGGSEPIGKAQLTAGQVIMQSIERLLLTQASIEYLKISFVVATGPLTAGAFTADLTFGDQDFRNYPNNYAA